MKNLEKVFKQIGKKLVFQFKRELEQQGHRASKSGSIIDGIAFKTSIMGLDVFTDKDYIHALNEGQKAHAPNLQNILDWIEDRKSTIPYANEQEKHEIAYAIIRKIKLEGTPTSGSFKYSDNARRTGFIEQVINTNKQQITKDIQSAVGKDIEILFTKLPKEI